jgi:hypothetical protein
MAAEHETRRARRGGDLPAPLPPAGADAGHGAHTSTTSTRTCEPRRSRPPSITPRSSCCASPSRTRARCPSPPSRCSARRATASARDRRELVLVDRRTTRSSSSCAPVTSPPTSAPGQLDVGITGRDLLLDGDQRRRGGAPARLRQLDVPLRGGSRDGDLGRGLRRQADRHQSTRGSWSGTSRRTASTPR